MCGPLVPNVSFFHIESNSDARVFSSAHTPVSPAGFSKRTSMPAKMWPAMRSFRSPSFTPWPPKKFVCRYGTPVSCESEPPTMPVLYGLKPQRLLHR